MELTQVYVEQVIIGAMVLVIAAILVTGVVWFPEESLGEVVAGGAFIAAAYVAGILYDRCADTLLERLDRQNRVRFALKRFRRTFPLAGDPFRKYGNTLVGNFPYLKSRMRILRALTTLVPLMALACLVARDPSDSGPATVSAAGIYVLIGVLCGLREYPTTHEFEKLNVVGLPPLWREPAILGLAAMTLLNVSFAIRDSDRLRALAIVLGGTVLTLIAAWAWLRVNDTVMRAIAGRASPTRPGLRGYFGIFPRNRGRSRLRTAGRSRSRRSSA